MNRTILALAALLGLCAAAAAQVPPPVPALPDSERRTSYSISGTTCACSVGFALYEDSTDVDQQIQVWINGVQFLSTDPSHGWGLTSATGPLASIPRPITDAVLTFTAVQTGTVQIVGAQRPRRLSQFAENRGVAARDLNQVLTYLTSTQRERWDLNSRTLRGLPGETITPLPSQASRASTVLGFDSSGNPTSLPVTLGLGTVVGPVSSVDGHVAVFSGTTGQIIRDGGPSVGTVSSVGLALPNIFSVSGSPVATAGTLTATLATETANFVFAGPTSGSAATPTFRALISQDIATASANILPVYLVIGDSNAVGQGSSASSPTVQSGQALTYCANGTIVDANDPTCSAVNASQNAATGSAWPAASIAYGRKIGLVLTGVSGSTQASAADFHVGNGNWQDTSAGSNYANSITAINAAITAFKAAGYAPVFQGIIYVLGSNDASQIDSSVITSGQYTSALTTMVANYRGATIGGTIYPHMQFWMPIIGTSTLVSDTGYSQVRAAQLAFAATDGNTAVPFVDMFSFNTRGLMNSGAHPTQAGYNIMGTAIGVALVPESPANIPYRLFNANAGIGGAAPTGTVVQVVGPNSSAAGIVLDAYAGAPQEILRRADTTLVAPSAVQNGDVTGIFGVQSFGATTFGSTNQGALLFSATQNQTDTAKGTQACIYTTANGSATPTCNLTVGQNGAITFAAITGSTQCLHVNSSGVLSGTGADCGSGSSGITIGTTTITSGTNGRLLFDNAGVVGETTSLSGLTGISQTSSATLDWNSDTFLGRSAAAGLRLGQADAASPIAQKLGVQNTVAGTSNTAGADWTIAGSQGTGTGTGGNIRFQVAPAGTTGTSQNALADILQIYSTQRINISKTNSAPDALLVINANTGTTPVSAPNGSVFHLVGADGANTTFTYDNFVNGAGTSNLFQARAASGTRGTPASLASGQLVFAVNTQGYDGVSAYQTLANLEILNINATTPTESSGQIRIRTTPTGAASSLSQRLLVSQGIDIGTSTTDPGPNAMLFTPQAFSGLTACSASLEGAVAEVNNSTTATWGATITGGGANKVLAHCNGTNWTVMGF